MNDLLATFERAPVTSCVLLAYVSLALVAGPLEPDPEQLWRLGQLGGLALHRGEPWRLLTHAFLHGGILHLLLNSVALWMLGPALEARLRSARFALLYCVSAIGGGLAAVLWNGPLQLVVGGSGALFGMLGAALAINMRQGRHLLDFLDYHGPRQLLGLIAVNLALGLLLPMISNAAHVGGLAAGFVLSFCFLERGREPADRLARAVQAGWIALCASFLLYVVRPVVRWDWLHDQGVEAAGDPERQQALLDALWRLPPAERGAWLASQRPR